MSMELTERTNNQESNESRDTLFLLGGAAMMVFAALENRQHTIPRP